LDKHYPEEAPDATGYVMLAEHRSASWREIINNTYRGGRQPAQGGAEMLDLPSFPDVDLCTG
jgi:hypothetical protein